MIQHKNYSFLRRECGLLNNTLFSMLLISLLFRGFSAGWRLRRVWEWGWMLCDVRRGHGIVKSI